MTHSNEVENETRLKELNQRNDRIKAAKCAVRKNLIKLIDDALAGIIPPPSQAVGPLDGMITHLVALHEQAKEIEAELFKAITPFVTDELEFTSVEPLPSAAIARKELGRALAHDIEVADHLSAAMIKDALEQREEESRKYWDAYNAKNQ